MRDLILITNSNYGLKEFHSILGNALRNATITSGKNWIFIECKEPNKFFGDSIKVEETSSLDIFYEPEEEKKIKKIVQTPNFYLINFKNIDLVKLIIKLIANREDLVVDNENGLITSGKKFMEILEKNPNWDWAYGPAGT